MKVIFWKYLASAGNVYIINVTVTAISVCIQDLQTSVLLFPEVPERKEGVVYSNAWRHAKFINSKHVLTFLCSYLYYRKKLWTFKTYFTSWWVLSEVAVDSKVFHGSDHFVRILRLLHFPWHIKGQTAGCFSVSTTLSFVSYLLWPQRIRKLFF